MRYSAFLWVTNNFCNNICQKPALRTGDGRAACTAATETVLAARSIEQATRRTLAGHRQARSAREQVSGPDRQGHIVRAGREARIGWCRRNTKFDSRISPAADRSG